MKRMIFMLVCLACINYGQAQQTKTTVPVKKTTTTKAGAMPKAKPTPSKVVKKDTLTRCLIETSKGNMTIVLYNETPLHRDNFIHLVKYGMYTGTLFHRIIDGFMIQGGDPNSKNATPGKRLGEGGVGYTVPAEFVSTLFHKKGALAAARQGDNVNPEKASSGCQFYIVQGRVFTKDELAEMEVKMNRKFTPEQITAYTTVGGTPFLDGNYTVFGEVTEGLAVIDSIAKAPRDQSDRPLIDISIKASLIK